MLTIYKASAGSGKTFTLTRDYLTLLLGVPADADNKQLLCLNRRSLRRARAGGRTLRRGLPNRHRYILAVTFTNKSTEEMKSRILAELEKLAKYADSTDPALRSPHTEYLIERFSHPETGQTCTVPELMEAARVALTELLNDMSHFNVSTIDSFFQAILRSMAYELDCPGDFEVTLDNKGVVGEAVHNMLDDFNYGLSDEANPMPLRGELRKYMEERRESGGDINLFNRNMGAYKSIVGDTLTVFDEQYRKHSRRYAPWLLGDGNIDAYRQWLKKRRKELCAQIAALSDTLDRDIAVFCDDMAVRLTHGRVNFDAARVRRDCLTSKFLALPDKLREIAAMPALKAKVFEKFTVYNTLTSPEALQTADPGSAAAAAVLKKKYLPLWPDLAKEISAAIAGIAAAMGNVLALELMDDQARTMPLMRHTLDYIQRFRRDSNMVILSDSAELIHRVMGNDSQVPFVYEKMEQRLNNLLIDEFQDTSLMQWESLEPFITNSLSEGNANLIIGDEKQAIYRFRNSDSSLLHTQVSGHYAKLGPDLTRIRGVVPAENTNWRSAGLIVRFNNTLFSRLAGHLGIEGYENVVQNISPKNLDRRAYIRFVNVPARIKASLAPEQPMPSGTEMRTFTLPPASAGGVIPMGSEQKAAASLPLTAFDLLVDQIRRQKAAGFSYSDIAVLTNYNSGGRNCCQALLAAGIPVSTSEALALSSSTTVNLIVGVLQSLLGAGDAVDDAPADLTYGYRGRKDPGVFSAMVEQEMNDALTGGDAGQEASSRAFGNAVGRICAGPGASVGANSDILRHKPSSLTSLVEAIVRERLGSSVRNADAPFIAALHDAILDYEEGGDCSIAGFLNWWRTAQSKYSIATPDNIDAVKIMTIHKSKGLEFKCVHIPDASWNFAGDLSKKEKVWIEIPDEERGADRPLPPAVQIAMDNRAAVQGCPFKPYYDSNMHARVTDGLNKTYVAYTRAGSELIVYYDPDKDAGADISALLSEPDEPQDSRLMCTAPTEGPADAVENTFPGEFTYGAPVDRLAEIHAAQPEQAPAPETPEEAEEGELYGHFGDYRINMRAGQRLTRLATAITMGSADDGAEDFYDDDDEDRAADEDGRGKRRATFSNENIDRGDRIHLALSTIHRLDGDFQPLLDRLLAKACRRRFMALTDDEADAIRVFMLHPLTNPQLRQWFGGFDSARNEVSVLVDVPVFRTDADGRRMRVTDAGGKPVLRRSTRRIDRLVFMPGGEIHILDYKTGAEPDTAANRAQMRRYMRLLADSYPDRTVRGFLLNIDNPTIEEVSPAPIN